MKVSACPRTHGVEAWALESAAVAFVSEPQVCLIQSNFYCFAAGGLAYPDAVEVQRVALRSIKLFDAGDQSHPCLRHTQTRRFLDATWRGLPGSAVEDVPLRPLVEELAAGASLLEIRQSHGSNNAACKNLFYWLSAFRLIRVAERSVEGRHSLVSRVRKRAPSATTPYVSLELRWPDLQRVATTQPALLESVQQRVQMLCTGAGFRATVQHPWQHKTTFLVSASASLCIPTVGTDQP